MLTFEYATNELIRLCLRFEQLKRGIDYFSHQPSPLESRACLRHFIATLQLLDRTDLRSKFSKHLHHSLINLQRLQNNEKIDQKKLTDSIRTLETQLNVLQSDQGKFAQRLRQNTLIESLLQHDNQVGGACDYNTPQLPVWLNFPAEQRMRQLQAWQQSLSDIQQTIQLLLDYIRSSKTPSQYTAQAGYFQMSLDAGTPSQLIRIIIPSSPVFPRISIGYHGISIRFIQSTTDGLTEKVTDDVLFTLACCTF